MSQQKRKTRKDGQASVLPPFHYFHALRMTHYALLIILLWLGCSSSQTTQPNRHVGQIPHDSVQEHLEFLERHSKWWTQLPSADAKYLYAVGVSSESRKKAVFEAEEELIRSLQIFVEAERYWKEIFTNDSFAVDMVEYRKERYRGTLPRTEVIDYHQEDNMHHVLIRLERAALEIQGKRDQGLVQDAFSDARALFAEGKILRSLQKHIDALSYARLLLEGTPFDRMYLYKNARQDLASQQIERELKQLLGQIQFSKVGDEQVGYFGEGLEEPLVVIARVKGNTAEGLPIQFSYRSGRGKFSDERGGTQRQLETHTSQAGRASVNVAQIESIHPRNEVVARMNLQPLLDQLPEDETERFLKLLQRIFEKHESREIIFQYKSLFMPPRGEALTVSLNSKSNHPIFEDKSEVTLTIETPKKGMLHIFHVNAKGEIRFQQAIRSEYAQRLQNLTISETPRGFEVSISGIGLDKESREPESEAMVVVAASRQVRFEKDVPIAKEVIFTRFNETGPNWAVGYVSYDVR
jgi:hypothetical protein